MLAAVRLRLQSFLLRSWPVSSHSSSLVVGVGSQEFLVLLPFLCSLIERQSLVPPLFSDPSLFMHLILPLLCPPSHPLPALFWCPLGTPGSSSSAFMPGLGYELCVLDTELWWRALAGCCLVDWMVSVQLAGYKGLWGTGPGHFLQLIPCLKRLVQAPKGALVCQASTNISTFNSLLMPPWDGCSASPLSRRG